MGEPPRASGATDRVPPVSAVAVVTRDRPESLRRCLASHLEAARRFGRRFEFLVLDDSVDADMRARNQAILGELQARYDFPIRYGGRAERVAYATALARSGCAADILQFALLGMPEVGNTCGANRNAVLLETLGAMSVSVDDDTSCRVARRSIRPGLALGKSPQWGQFEFYDEPGEVERSLSSEGEIDLVSLHEQLLGQPVAASIERFAPDGRIDGDRLPLPLFSRIADGRAHTRVTQMGFAGDPGTASPFAYLLLEGSSRERLLQSERTYRAASLRAPAMRHIEQLAVSAHPYCMSYVLGLDNRHGLPPFFPVLRSSDTIFGLTLRFSDVDAYVGQIPHAVDHAPPGRRAWGPDAIWRAPLQWTTSDVLTLAIIAMCSPSAGKTHLGRTVLGRSLIDLASRPMPEFEQVIRQQRVRREEARAGQLRLCLERHGGEPSYWAQDAKRALVASLEAIGMTRLSEPSDLPETVSGQGRRSFAKWLVGAYGRLLTEWDGILEGVRRLREAGVRLTVSV
jgi:hypothetical protein